jgi:WD40 repeat protein
MRQIDLLRNKSTPAQQTLAHRLLLALAAGLLAVALAGGAVLPQGGPETQPPTAESPKAPAEKAEVGLDAQGDPLPAGALARLGTVRFRHGGRVISLSPSADGKLLATGAGDGAIRLWDLTTGRLVRRFDLGAMVVGSAVALSPDGKTLAAPAYGKKAGAREEVGLWDAATGNEIRRMETPPDAVCSCLAFSPDGKALAAGEWESGKVRVWDAGTGKEIRAWKGHDGRDTLVAFSADGKRLVTTAHDGTIRLWDMADGTERWSFTLPGRRGVGGDNLIYYFQCAALSPDGKVLAAALDTTVRLWDVTTDKELHFLKWESQDSYVGAVAFSPDGKTLLTGSGDGRIRFWDVATGKMVRELPGRQEGIAGLFFTPDGKRIVSGGSDMTIHVRDAATGKELHDFAGHKGRVAGLAYSPDGKLLATAGQDGTLRLWSGTKEVRRLVIEGAGEAKAVAFAPDGKTLAAALAPAGHMRADAAFSGIYLWDVATGQKLRRLPGPRHLPGEPYSLAFAPDGRSLAAADFDKTIRLSDPATGKELRRLGSGRLGIHLLGGRKLAFSPDGKLLASGGVPPFGGAIEVWDPGSGKELPVLPKDDADASDLAFSPDGTLLATASEDCTVRLWDVARRTLARSWKFGDGRESSGPLLLTFSRDGRMLVTAGETPYLLPKPAAQTIRVWEVVTGQERCSFRGHDGPIRAVAVSPDCAVIASAGEDTTVLLWDLAGRGPAGALTAEEAAGLWTDLASEDAARAFRAIRRLVRSPEQAVPLLKDQLAPVPPADPKRVARQIADLDSEDFATREKAAEELGKMAEGVERQLREALKGSPSAEARRRLEWLIRALEGWPPERLRVARAVEVLERVGTAKAREVLKALAEGSPEAWLTREARATLERLGR